MTGKLVDLTKSSSDPHPRTAPKAIMLSKPARGQKPLKQVEPVSEGEALAFSLHGESDTYIPPPVKQLGPQELLPGVGRVHTSKVNPIMSLLNKLSFNRASALRVIVEANNKGKSKIKTQ